MKPNPDELSNYLHRNYPGASYHSAYEAGFCRLWAHHRLRSLGIDNMVVNSEGIITGIITIHDIINCDYGR